MLTGGKISTIQSVIYDYNFFVNNLFILFYLQTFQIKHLNYGENTEEMVDRQYLIP